MTTGRTTPGDSAGVAGEPTGTPGEPPATTDRRLNRFVDSNERELTPGERLATSDRGPAADLLPARIRSVLGRSLHVPHLDAGSCNGCDWEIAAVLNPYHDVQRLGIDFVASPRHADLLLVTGVMTRALEEAACRTYEAMPEPRLVVALGACAISGGVFAGSSAARNGVGGVLPVDVFVPGCPPRPEAIIEGLLVAVGRLEAPLRERRD